MEDEVLSTHQEKQESTHPVDDLMTAVPVLPNEAVRPAGTDYTSSIASFQMRSCIIPLGEMVCMEGSPHYIARVLEKMQASPMRIGWQDSRPIKGTCAQRGYKIAQPDSCFPKATRYFDDNAYHKMAASRMGDDYIEMYRKKYTVSDQEIEEGMSQICLNDGEDASPRELSHASDKSLQQMTYEPMAREVVYEPMPRDHLDRDSEPTVERKASRRSIKHVDTDNAMQTNDEKHIVYSSDEYQSDQEAVKKEHRHAQAADTHNAVKHVQKISEQSAGRSAVQNGYTNNAHDATAMAPSNAANTMTTDASMAGLTDTSVTSAMSAEAARANRNLYQNRAINGYRGWYKILKGMRIQGNALHDTTIRNERESELWCNRLGKDCTGFTCWSAHNCTVNNQAEVIHSPGEVAYVKSKDDAQVTNYKPVQSMALADYAAGDKIERSEYKSETWCNMLGDICKGYTCVAEGRCTVRATTNLARADDPAVVSYVKDGESVLSKKTELTDNALPSTSGEIMAPGQTTDAVPSAEDTGGLSASGLRPQMPGNSDLAADPNAVPTDINTEVQSSGQPVNPQVSKADADAEIESQLQAAAMRKGGIELRPEDAIEERLREAARRKGARFPGQ
eukprot:gnl/TRDRNA2_/TRDRNA2_177715_c3_seq2.p1 gnl/TRDRNA2_/TRDRNA2_177715_c3~~gnl/TRDRNA2_/TRDRNA2_177715_c3_seq2.p1  ORF type:complete len:721 (-),score=120.43 gnl/TRDRNA2_/TRDRNA2_177715_c3_seq2:450-2309(-)